MVAGAWLGMRAGEGAGWSGRRERSRRDLRTRTNNSRLVVDELVASTREQVARLDNREEITNRHSGCGGTVRDGLGTPFGGATRASGELTLVPPTSTCDRKPPDDLGFGHNGSVPAPEWQRQCGSQSGIGEDSGG